jgi:hypothetical protein
MLPQVAAWFACAVAPTLAIWAQIGPTGEMVDCTW